MSKKVLIIAIIIFITAAAGVYFLYQKPRVGMSGLYTEYRVSAMELFADFQQNEDAADKKYLNKIINVTGKIQTIQRISNNSRIVVISAGENATGGINCNITNMQATDTALIKAGGIVTIKGRCTGFLTDVNISDAMIEH